MREGIIYDCENVNCTTPLYMGTCRKDCHERYNKLMGNKTMTNADHIRAMTDEELCDFILDKRENGNCFNNRCYVNDPHKGCGDCTMEWLKQPYKEEKE